MTFDESPAVFDCDGVTMVGVLARPAAPAGTGVLIVVGGPQYRVGSHRQFVLLARHLAAQGVAVLRFDLRGMGDSGGERAGFEASGPDLAAAIDFFLETVPEVTRVILWGLCDAASAALLYLDESGDRRVAGLCLSNPWVRSEDTLASARVKHYYTERLVSPEFWHKLLQGRVRIGAALAELLGTVRRARMRPGPALGFQERMKRALMRFDGPLLLILSGNDLTAREFADWVDRDPETRARLRSDRVTRIEIAGADHTFSSRAWRESVQDAVSGWYRRAIDPGDARARECGAR